MWNTGHVASFHKRCTMFDLEIDLLILSYFDSTDAEFDAILDRVEVA